MGNKKEFLFLVTLNNIPDQLASKTKWKQNAAYLFFETLILWTVFTAVAWHFGAPGKYKIALPLKHIQKYKNRAPLVTYLKSCLKFNYHSPIEVRYLSLIKFMIIFLRFWRPQTVAPGDTCRPLFLPTALTVSTYSASLFKIRFSLPSNFEA